MSDNRPSTRRRPTSFAVLTAAAALVTGLAIAGHAAHRQATSTGDDSPSSLSAHRTAPSPAAPPSATTADLAPSDAAGGRAAAAPGPVNVRYFFDGGARQPVLDSSSAHPMRILTAKGGTIGYVRRANGWALQFPRRCRAAATTCPRAIMQGVRDDTLNPGTRTFQYGAAILMSRTDTADGANVLQKGYSTGGGSQFKLQVDHAAGRPSCVLASRTTIYRAESRTTVADGRWHALACQRVGTKLNLYVDGGLKATRTVPASLSIVNPEPLRIGGKGTNANNDQYAGQLDNVYVSIG